MKMNEQDEPRLAPPPKIVLDAESSFEEVMAQLKGIQIWCERLFWAYNVQNTELIDARFALQNALANVAVRDTEYVNMSNRLVDIETELLRRRTRFWQRKMKRTNR